MNLETAIEQRIEAIKDFANIMPGIVIILNIQKGFSVEFMSKSGTDVLGVTLQELQNMGTDYHSRFFNMKDLSYYLVKVETLLAQNDVDQTFTLFQQVRSVEEADFQWYFTSTKIFMQDFDGNPLLALFHAIEIDPNRHLSKKVNQLLEESTFFRDHYPIYRTLTKREKELLLLFAKGTTNKTIAEKLFISIDTIDTHKKNLKKKLGVKENSDFIQYARAFELE
ncbi:response regulator transcription factor [Marinoscillum sp.]|uniref:helix-turn-helix transcriptional regulator n=1 Tax=Marinoscillum sp. TaxID=2024838 RepID=UPI003BAD3FA2